MIFHMTISTLLCRKEYSKLGEEAVVINVLAATLLAMVIVIPVLLLNDKYRSQPVHHEAENHGL